MAALLATEDTENARRGTEGFEKVFLYRSALLVF